MRRIKSGPSGLGHSIEKARAGCGRVLDGDLQAAVATRMGKLFFETLYITLFLNLLPFFFFPYPSCVLVSISSF